MQDAVNMVTKRVYYDNENEIWTPSTYVVRSEESMASENMREDIEQFWGPVVPSCTSCYGGNNNQL